MQCALCGNIFEDLGMLVRKIMIELWNLDRDLFMLHLVRWGTAQPSKNGLFCKLKRQR